MTINDRQIYYFKEGENIYNCSCCNMEYTQRFRSDGKVIIKRIITKNHLKNKGDDIVHYITHWAEIVLYLPLNEVDDNDNMSKKWMRILSSLKRAWEAGNTNIHAIKIMSLTPEFILLLGPPLLTGAEILNFKPDKLDELTTSTKTQNYMCVDINELGLLLNNK